MSKKSSLEELKCLKFLKNSSENTIKGYLTTIRKYEAYHGINMETLVNEALDEQTNQVPPHLLKIIDRIESFQQSLIDANMVYGSIKINVSRIKNIYRKNRVVIPYIESINPKTCRRREAIEFKDVLTKEELRSALPHMRLPSRARAMTMIQGGLSNEECEHLTLRAFLDELSRYHQQEDDVSALQWLADENHPVIWVTKLIRIKTGKPYYATIGAEAVNTIASAKLYEMDLPTNNGVIPEKLLNTHKGSFTRLCQKLNDRLGFGKVAEECKLRSHNLRRFHATYIKGSVLTYEENILSNSDVDEMQGRGKTQCQDTYIKTNPLQQKLLYAKVMNNVSLYHQYEYEILDGDVRIFIKDAEKLEHQVKDLKKKLENKNKASKRVQELRNELGDDVFRELIGEILKVE